MLPWCRSTLVNSNHISVSLAKASVQIYVFWSKSISLIKTYATFGGLRLFKTFFKKWITFFSVCACHQCGALNLKSLMPLWCASVLISCDCERAASIIRASGRDENDSKSATEDFNSECVQQHLSLSPNNPERSYFIERIFSLSLARSHISAAAFP
jgi:hypothetical protein